jgi:menaquinone-dependent protoporphyrinogen oxidase
LSTALRRHGLAVELRDAAEPGAIRLGDYAAAVLAASVHLGRHEREMVRFARAHAAELQRLPTAFLSVSLTAATLARPGRAPADRARAAAEVQRLITQLGAATGWQPGITRAVAGALVYSRYNFLVRWVMKLMAKQAGGDTDTSRDYEYTDYGALDRLADELAAQLGDAAAPADEPAHDDGPAPAPPRA